MRPLLSDKEDRPAPGRVQNDRGAHLKSEADRMIRRRQRSGQALVEFALAIPLFLGFVFAIIQIGLVFIAYYSEAEMALRESRWLAINANATDSTFSSHVNTDMLPGMMG